MNHFITLLLLILAAPYSKGCTTFIVGRDVTVDGSVMSSHSNDGDGDTAGNLQKIRPKQHATNASRVVSGGSVPQVNYTYGYFTKVGGYASLSENQVALAESTCSSIFSGKRSDKSVLNIVDLSELGLERGQNAEDTIRIMGSLAEKYGYYDAGESLLVSDPQDAWIFHVSPDDTQTSAIWAAQRVPSDHVAVVANMFVIREINLTSSNDYMYSKNLLDVAERSTSWTRDQKTLDFTALFSGPEGRKYVSGRRMWIVLSTLSVETFSSEYDDYVLNAPYPATAKAKIQSVDISNMTSLMRNYYKGTPYDLSGDVLAAGPFSSPFRAAANANQTKFFERSISTPRSIVSYVTHVSSHFSSSKLATLWFAFHAAHTSIYIPFVVGMTQLPVSHTNNSLVNVDRGIGGFNAARFVFNIAQIHFDLAIQDIRSEQDRLESESQALVHSLKSSTKNMSSIGELLRENAAKNVKAWWDLSDLILLHYADGYCNNCGHGPRHIGYPTWWLNKVL
jgi:dipeptidase